MNDTIRFALRTLYGKLSQDGWYMEGIEMDETYFILTNNKIKKVKIEGNSNSSQVTIKLFNLELSQTGVKFYLNTLGCITVDIYYQGNLLDLRNFSLAYECSDAINYFCKSVRKLINDVPELGY